jgi:hypothetical protein
LGNGNAVAACTAEVEPALVRPGEGRNGGIAAAALRGDGVV